MKLKYYLRGLGTGIAVTAIIMSFIRQPEKLTDTQIKLRAHELGMVEKNVLADLQEDNEILSENEEEKNEVSQEDTFQEEETDVGEYTEVKNEKEEITAENTLTLEENAVADSTENEKVSENINENEITAESSKEDQDITEEQEITKQPEKLEEDTPGNVTIVGSFSESTIPISNGISENEVVENYVIVFLESGYGSEYASKRVYEAGLVDSWLELNRYLVRNGLDRKIRAGNHEIPEGATMEEIARILCRQE